MEKSETITSRSNPSVKIARSLKDRKVRNKAGKFLVEGIHHVGEASAAGWNIDFILYSPESLTSGFAKNLLASEESKGVRCLPVSTDILESLADKDNPQGLLAVVNQKAASLDSLLQRSFCFGVALVSPQDPGNVGTILRTLDAVGGDGLILLDGGVDPFHPSAVRASMGTLFWKPVATASFDDFTGWARQNRYQLIGTSAHAAIDYRDAKLEKLTSILVLGSEQKGLSEVQLAACDVSIKLPMHGRASSLNLAVAAGVLLYELLEKRDN